MHQAAQLTIDNINIRLPQGFEKRADSIARNLAKQLAMMEFSVSESRTLAELNLANVKINAGEANTVIARRLAQSIAQQVNHTQTQVSQSQSVSSQDKSSQQPGGKAHAD